MTADPKAKIPEFSEVDSKEKEEDKTKPKVEIHLEGPNRRFSESAPPTGSPTSAELMQWLRSNRSEWLKLEGRYVVFDRQHGVRHDAEHMGAIIEYITEQNLVTEGLLLRRVPNTPDEG